MYHDLAVSEKGRLDHKQLQMTVREFASRCKDASYLANNTPLLYTVAHLASSAVRLYSIEELLRSARWQKYWQIANLPDQQQIKLELKTHVDNLVHYLLRHGVAHSESEWQHLRLKNAFETMYDFYLDLEFHSLFRSMAAVRQAIKSEINRT